MSSHPAIDSISGAASGWYTRAVRLRKYGEAELSSAVAAVPSIRQALLRLGVAPYGGNYEVFKRAVVAFEISTKHFTGRASALGNPEGSRSRPLTDYFEGRAKVTNTNRFRRRLLREGVFERRCGRCKGDEWMGEVMPLELHHVDGNRSNNAPSNLILLCPNCHALTATYRGKNKKRPPATPRALTHRRYLAELRWTRFSGEAGVAKLADAGGLNPPGRSPVWVRIPPPA